MAEILAVLGVFGSITLLNFVLYLAGEWLIDEARGFLLPLLIDSTAITILFFMLYF